MEFIATVILTIIVYEVSGFIARLFTRNLPFHAPRRMIERQYSPVYISGYLDCLSRYTSLPSDLKPHLRSAYPFDFKYVPENSNQ